MTTAHIARVADVNGKPTLLVNDKSVYPMFYALTDSPGGRWTWEELPQQNLRRFAAAGVRLFQVDLFYELIYAENGALSIDVVRRQLRGVLDACPEAGIVIRLHMNPLPSWIASHPEEWTRYADTEVRTKTYPGLYRPLADDCEPLPRASLASTAWRDEATCKLREVLAELAKTPEGNSLIGIQPACGIFGEWHYWASLAHEPDTGTAMTAYFRQWLRGKYATDAALRQAWNDGSVSLETAQVPGMSHRQRCLDGIFRDPVRERPMIDYLMAQHQCVAEDILHFCRVVKESWPRPLVTGTFYNYFFTLFGRASICGHLAIRQVIESPWVDYLSAPHAWNPDPRGMGCKQHRGLVSSCRLHNKLWLDELDTNTQSGGVLRKCVLSE